MTDQYFEEVKSAFPAFDFSQNQAADLKACVDGAATPADTARTITRYPEAASSPMEMHQRLGGLWTLFSDAAVHIPQAHPQIISLMQEIQKLPKGPEPEGEGKDHFDLDDGWYWRELTGWGSLWADDFNSKCLIRMYCFILCTLLTLRLARLCFTIPDKCSPCF